MHQQARKSLQGAVQVNAQSLSLTSKVQPLIVSSIKYCGGEAYAEWLAMSSEAEKILNARQQAINLNNQYLHARKDKRNLTTASSQPMNNKAAVG